MCDCPQDQDDDLAASNEPQLFEKCQGSRDPVESRDWKTIALLEPPNDVDFRLEETPKPPSSGCSSDSTREVSVESTLTIDRFY